MVHSVLQVIRGSYEITKSRCQETIECACLEFRRQGGTGCVDWHVIHLLRVPGAKGTEVITSVTQGEYVGGGEKRKTGLEPQGVAICEAC